MKRPFKFNEEQKSFIVQYFEEKSNKKMEIVGKFEEIFNIRYCYQTILKQFNELKNNKIYQNNFKKIQKLNRKHYAKKKLSKTEKKNHMCMNISIKYYMLNKRNKLSKQQIKYKRLNKSKNEVIKNKIKLPNCYIVKSMKFKRKSVTEYKLHYYQQNVNNIIKKILNQTTKKVENNTLYFF